MGTGGTPSLGSPKSREMTFEVSDGQFIQVTERANSVYYSKFYGQAERAISNGKLNVLLRLHIRPINVVVFHGPTKLSLGKSHLGEGFALICFQRLS
jgi:hypothetical protein